MIPFLIVIIGCAILAFTNPWLGVAVVIAGAAAAVIEVAWRGRR